MPVVICPGAVVLEHTGEDFHLVGFAPLGGEARRAGLALVEEGLDIGFGYRDAGRAAVNDTPQGHPV